jgi:hypothetical protein
VVDAAGRVAMSRGIREVHLDWGRTRRQDARTDRALGGRA